MTTNYFADLWEKAEKLGIKKGTIGVEIFGQKKYRYIYTQGRVSPHMIKRHADIDAAIDRIAQRRKK